MNPFSMISSFLNPGEGYKKAGKQYDQAWQDAQRFSAPYNENGQKQIPKLNNAEDRLLNPMGLQNEWTQGYETSPYALQSMEEAKNSGLDAASSMGLMGSSAALNNITNKSHNIMQQDRQQFLNDLMQKYMTGIGLGQNMYNTGAGTANNMSQNAMTHGQNAAEMAYGEQNAPGQLVGDMLRGGAQMYLAANGAYAPRYN